MELSLEICSIIVSRLGSRRDISSLARVSKTFQIAAERSLYNTLIMADMEQTSHLCRLLARQPRLSSLVVALTISLDEGSDASDSEPSQLPVGYWEDVHRALLATRRLRYLDIYIDSGYGQDLAWILHDCTFQLRSLHSDMAWDSNLATFLANQSNLSQLHISDFDARILDNEVFEYGEVSHAHSLPRLSVLECTFIEAVSLLTPGRPVTHIKTCFSANELEGKRAEIAALTSSIERTTAPLRSLNIPDSSYDDRLSLEILSSIVKSLQPDPLLQYIGPLTLPVDGRMVRPSFYFPARS